jgi:hypothetical protein
MTLSKLLDGMWDARVPSEVMRTIRQLPRWQVVARMKAARVRQRDVADHLDMNQATVNMVLARSPKIPAATAGRVWDYLESVLDGGPR